MTSLDLTFQDIPNLSCVDHLRVKTTLYFPDFLTPGQREWEYYVTKLHGADLAASKEDLETLKNLVNKLGR